MQAAGDLLVHATLASIGANGGWSRALIGAAHRGNEVAHQDGQHGAGDDRRHSAEWREPYPPGPKPRCGLGLIGVPGRVISGSGVELSSPFHAVAMLGRTAPCRPGHCRPGMTALLRNLAEEGVPAEDVRVEPGLVGRTVPEWVVCETCPNPAERTSRGAVHNPCPQSLSQKVVARPVLIRPTPASAKGGGWGVSTGLIIHHC